jgi:hypothetical protein
LLGRTTIVYLSLPSNWCQRKKNNLGGDINLHNIKTNTKI